MRSIRALSIVALAAILAACSGGQTRVGAQENMLIAAGFKVEPADTPAKVAALKNLPANRIVARTKNGKSVYLYADPKVCKCLYRGNADAYRQYRKMVFEQNLADEQEMSAELNQEAAFDWQVWGSDDW